MDDNIQDKLNSLESLLKQGIISQNEYELNRKKILENISPPDNPSSIQEPIRENPQEILRKSLALGKISTKEYKSAKELLDGPSGILEHHGVFSEEYYILRMRLAYGEIKPMDFSLRLEELAKEETKIRKAREKDEKQKRKAEEKNEKNTWINRDIDLSLLVKEIEKFFHEKNFDVRVEKNNDESMYQIQATKKGMLNTITSSRKSLDVIIKGNSNNFSIGINAGEWGKNIAIAALIPYYGWTVGLAGLGMNMYFKKNLWDFIKSTIKKLENNRRQ